MSGELVLVTEKEHAKGAEVFDAAALTIEPAPPEETALAAAVRARRARAVIVGIQPYRGPLYEALAQVAGARGAILARFGVGMDNIDRGQATALGITVTNTPGVLDRSVAEHALWLAGGLARHVARAESNFRAGRFQGATGTELHGKTMGLIGFGPIAQNVARIAHFGFGMNVVAAGRRSPETLARDMQMPWPEFLQQHGLADYTDDADAVFRQADVLSIHLPATPETRHFVDARRLRLLRPAALLVNTARGSVVDEAALYDALAGNALAGAALDVFDREPYAPVAPDKDLRMLENVLLTPHIGSNTGEANRRMAEASLARVLAFLAGSGA